MNKRGQFFLIATLVVTAVLVELGSVYVATTTQTEDSQTYDLSEEIEFEASQVIYNAVTSGDDPEEISNQISELTAFYAKTNPESDIAIYYGNQEDVNVILYDAEDCVDFNPSSGDGDGSDGDKGSEEIIVDSTITKSDQISK